MKSNWPEYTPEPGESPRWPFGLIVIVAAAVLLFMSRPNLPDFRIPDIDVAAWFPPAPPAVDQAEQQPPATASISEIPGFSDDYGAVDPYAASADGSITRSVPFEACLETTAQLPMGGKPEVLEDNADRRVLRFHFGEGAMTITCSRRDQTMTIEQSNAG
jgi:hypothetical protein